MWIDLVLWWTWTFRVHLRLQILNWKFIFSLKKWQFDKGALKIFILHSNNFLFFITYNIFIIEDDLLLVRHGNYKIFFKIKLYFHVMLKLMNYKIYKRKTMYHCSGFFLIFQCWFYEFSLYFNKKLVERVWVSVPCILNWLVITKSNYKKVKSELCDINWE